MRPIVSSMAAHQVVIMTAKGATSDDRVVIMTTLGLQCCIESNPGYKCGQYCFGDHFMISWCFIHLYVINTSSVDVIKLSMSHTFPQ